MGAVASAKSVIQKESGTTSPTGTITSVGTTVTGATGPTAFLTDFKPGDIIKAVSGGVEEGRIIAAVVDDDELTLFQAFSTDIAVGVAYKKATMSDMIGMTDWSGPQMSAAEIDVSTFGNKGAASFIAGLRDPGQATFTLYFESKRTLHLALLANFKAGSLLAWRAWQADSVAELDPPDTSNSRVIMFGSVTGFNMGAQLNGAWTAEITVRLSGDPEIVPGTDV